MTIQTIPLDSASNINILVEDGKYVAGLGQASNALPSGAPSELPGAPVNYALKVDTFKRDMSSVGWVANTAGDYGWARQKFICAAGVFVRTGTFDSTQTTVTWGTWAATV